jgi:NAD(P)-dependent dehydrogenase (short-subunit alcohol dehydrogenase family)
MTPSPFDLTGKTALVIGGRGYLGRHVTAALAAHGAHVVSADLAESSRAAVRADAAIESGANDQRIVDVTIASSVDTLVADVLTTYGGIDILVYAVTTKPADFYRPFAECSLEGWQSILHAELDGAFLTTQRVGAAMEARGGSIVLLGSIYGVVGNDQRLYEEANLAEVYGQGSETRTYAHAGYATAKGAIVAFTRFLAAYWGHRQIRVNCVSPGGVSHPAENDAFVRRYADRTPLGRKAEPDDVASAIVYLASDAAKYVTGHNLLVDGGWTCW